MDYEKGAPGNIVTFSKDDDIAFTDTGVRIGDDLAPSCQVVWTSKRIMKELETRRGPNGIEIDGPGGSNVSVNLPNEYYTNGYRRFLGRSGPGKTRGHIRFRVMKPSWWLSWIIPTRAHYCDKCCSYMDHKWATSWNDDPSLANNKCSQKCQGSQ